MPELSIIDQIWNTAAAISLLEWVATILSISYVILAAKGNPWCWPLGLLSVIITFMVYIRPDVRLYSEATLQVYYMVMSVYGWMAWTKKKDETASSESLISIQRWTIKQHLMAFGSGIVLLLLLGSFWSWMGGALPYVDAFTTAFSIIATYMVTQKIIENWIYWIVIDLVSVFINWERGLYLFAVLFAVYCIVAIFGFIEWRRKELKINRTY